MAKGDHVKVRRLGYSHHGIDCGDGTVIHYTGANAEKEAPVVRRTSLVAFAQGRTIRTVRHRSTATPEDVMARAFSLLGKADYHLFFNNCEHFASWCVTGRARSRQVKRVIRLACSVSLASSVIVMGVARISLARRSSANR